MLFLIYNIFLQLSAEYGFGRDISEIESPDDLSRAILYEIIGQTLLITGNVSAKLSIGFFMVRLVTRWGHKVAIWTPVFIFSFFAMVSTFVLWFSCQPTAYLWNRRINGRCDVDPGPTAVLAGALSVFVDLWYSGFPWYLLVSDVESLYRYQIHRTPHSFLPFTRSTDWAVSTRLLSFFCPLLEVFCD